VKVEGRRVKVKGEGEGERWKDSAEGLTFSGFGSEAYIRGMSKHIIYSLFAPALFFLVGTSPVEILGCRGRGLAALIIAFVSVLAGLGAALMAVKYGRKGEQPRALRWAVSALILAIPPAALIYLA
jgi:hypothetical protein